MVSYFQSEKGYFYKVIKGKKVRISKKVFNENIMKGGVKEIKNIIHNYIQSTTGNGGSGGGGGNSRNNINNVIAYLDDNYNEYDLKKIIDILCKNIDTIEFQEKFNRIVKNKDELNKKITTLIKSVKKNNVNKDKIIHCLQKMYIKISKLNVNRKQFSDSGNGGGGGGGEGNVNGGISKNGSGGGGGDGGGNVNGGIGKNGSGGSDNGGGGGGGGGDGDIGNNGRGNKKEINNLLTKNKISNLFEIFCSNDSILNSLSDDQLNKIFVFFSTVFTKNNIGEISNSIIIKQINCTMCLINVFEFNKLVKSSMIVYFHILVLSYLLFY